MKPPDSLLTYPKILIHEGVDERIDVGAAHCEEMNRQKCIREGQLMQILAPLFNDFRIKVNPEEEQMEGEPADGEDQDNHHQHLDHLQRNGRKHIYCI